MRRILLSSVALAIAVATQASAQCTDSYTFHGPSGCSSSSNAGGSYACGNLYDTTPLNGDVGSAYTAGSANQFSHHQADGAFGTTTMTYVSPISANSFCYQNRVIFHDRVNQLEFFAGGDVNAPSMGVFPIDDSNSNLACFDFAQAYEGLSAITMRFRVNDNSDGGGNQYWGGGSTLYLTENACGPTPTTTTVAPTPPPTPACNCATTTNLEVDYSSNDIPDATGSAIVDIFLDKTVWEVKFVVSNVKSINNGHVIPHSVDTQQLSAVDAFSPNTAAFVQADLWNPPQCSLGPVDTASTNAASGAEGVEVGFNPVSCEKNYTMSYSLISPSLQDMKHCELNVNGAVITVNCSVTLSTVRAYDLTEPLSYTAQETAFAASIDLRNDLTFTETNLLHATMAKCSVKNGPLYVVDCRVPGEWVFDQSAFSLVQEPAGWIDASSCASNVVGTGDTASSYIRCNIVNNAPIADVQTARANLTAHRVGAAAGDDLTFDVEYIIPRKVTTTASASLASFVTSIAMADGLYYYGTADKAVLEIGVVDSARLSMTALELFNDASPRVVYDIFPGTSDARFQTALNAVTDKFTIEFYPAAIREDSEFYRYGPHGINVSFTFSAARRAISGSGARQTDGGFVQVSGLNVEGTEATTSSGAQGSAASSSSGTALMAGVAVGAAVLVAGLVGAAVVAVKRRNAAAAEQKEQL